MRFVKLGDRRINLDQICHLFRDVGPESDPPAYRVYFGPGHFVRLAETEAMRLLEYIDSEAIDLAPATGDDRDFAEFRRRGGTLPRSEWDSLNRQLREWGQGERSNAWWQRMGDRVADVERELLL